MESTSTSDDEGGAISWIFSAEVLEHKTPSREDGISSDTERKYRREGARFIINASNTLKLYLTYATYSININNSNICHRGLGFGVMTFLYCGCILKRVMDSWW